MDASASAENSKKQKVSEDRSDHHSQDRISHLPQDILHHILSLVPTKNAVATSVLSTKWKYLWTSIHNLDFYEWEYSDKKTRKDYSERKRIFFDFVNRVLQLHDITNIQKFKLRCSECDAANLKEWISIVIRRKAQELILSIDSKEFCFFPHCFLNCEWSRILKVNMKVFMEIPSSTCLPILKVLHLNNIIFYGKQLMQEVCLSFPVLKDFILCDCAWFNIKTIRIYAPKLLNLSMEDYHHEGVPDCKMKVYAESLVSLELSTDLSLQYSLHRLSSLVYAIIDLRGNHTVVSRVGSFLRRICNVKYLELSAGSIETLSLPAISAHMRSLSRLIHLRVMVDYHMNGRKLIDLLCNVPNIQILTLPSGINPSAFKGHGRIIGTTPRDFLSKLKLVHIRYFRGIEVERWFIKFLVRSVGVEDKMTIKLEKDDYYSDKYWKECIAKQLETFVKDSKCVLVLTEIIHKKSRWH